MKRLCFLAIFATSCISSIVSQSNNLPSGTSCKKQKGMACMPNINVANMNCNLQATCPTGTTCCTKTREHSKYFRRLRDEDIDNAMINTKKTSKQATPDLSVIEDLSCSKKRCGRAGGICSSTGCPSEVLEHETDKLLCGSDCECCKTCDLSPPRGTLCSDGRGTCRNVCNSNEEIKSLSGCTGGCECCVNSGDIPLPPGGVYPPPKPEFDKCLLDMQTRSIGCNKVGGTCRTWCLGDEKKSEYGDCKTHGCQCCIKKEDICEPSKDHYGKPIPTECSKINGKCRMSCPYGEIDSYYSACPIYGCKCCVPEIDKCIAVSHPYSSKQKRSIGKDPCGELDGTCRSVCWPGEERHWAGECDKDLHCNCCIKENDMCSLTALDGDRGFCINSGGACRFECMSDEQESPTATSCRDKCKCCHKIPEACSMVDPEKFSDCVNLEGTCNTHCPLGTQKMPWVQGCEHPCYCCAPVRDH